MLCKAAVGPGGHPEGAFCKSPPAAGGFDRFDLDAEILQENLAMKENTRVGMEASPCPPLGRPIEQAIDSEPSLANLS